MNDGVIVALCRTLRRLPEEAARDLLERNLTPDAIRRLSFAATEAAIEEGGKIIDGYYRDRPWIERRAAGEEQAS